MMREVVRALLAYVIFSITFCLLSMSLFMSCFGFRSHVICHWMSIHVRGHHYKKAHPGEGVFFRARGKGRVEVWKGGMDGWLGYFLIIPRRGRSRHGGSVYISGRGGVCGKTRDVSGWGARARARARRREGGWHVVSLS